MSVAAPKFPEVSVRLSGTDSNAGALMGLVVEGLYDGGATPTQVKEFREECMSGDYDHLLRTCMAWVDVY